MDSNLPELCHSVAGMTTGNRTSCPSIASISSRRMRSILFWMRFAGMNSE